MNNEAVKIQNELDALMENFREVKAANTVDCGAPELNRSCRPQSWVLIKAPITLEFTNGQQVKTRLTSPAKAISRAVQVSPVRGSVAGTKLLRNGEVFGVITNSLGWMEGRKTLIPGKK